MIIVIFVIIVFMAISLIKKDKGLHHSNWSTLVPSFNYSSEEFYTQLKEAIRENKIRGIDIKVVDEKEGNSFSRSRKYLKVTWKEYSYYVCIATFGDGLFISWWLYYKQRNREKLIASIPVIGPILLNKLFPVTMYRVDSASMYMTYCHNTMKEILEEITKDTGFRLNEFESLPNVSEIFER